MAAKRKARGSKKAASKKTPMKTRTTKAAARKLPAKRSASRKVAARKPAGRSGIKPRHQPESLRLRSASPSLTVGDVQRSLAFYRDVLGFTEKERWQQDGVLRGVEMTAGHVSVWLGQDDWKKGRDRIKGQGFRLYCSTRQDVDALAAQIRARGGTLAEEPTDMSWGGRAFGIVDPDGFAITIANET
jgi:lactoylglutathione lyase